MSPALSRKPVSAAAPLIRVRFEAEFTTDAIVEDLHCSWFTVHGERHPVGDPVAWLTNPSDDIEWHIVLHKFFHAPVLVQRWRDSGETRHIELLSAHVASWIACVLPGFIAADVTGRRIRNWVYALSLLEGDFPDLQRAMIASLKGQVEWLRGNLHPARNHRTLELFAIYLAGVFLEEREWSGFAMTELLDNARSDFLPDGAHVELSSHYHCIALRNFIETIELADDNGLPIPDELRAIVTRASLFAHALHKPDGMIPALSDADTGDYRAMLGPAPAFASIETFPDGGYTVMRDKAAVAGDPRGGYLVLDHGSIGAGNHGHIDCLSIEFAAGGRSLIVDPGRFTYSEQGETNWRARFRATRAHNLVQVDGLEQTLYRQGPKRMKIAGPSPAAGLLGVHDFGQWRLVQGWCESALYAVRHERSIISHDDGWWVVHDRLIASSEHLYELLFQLDPQTQDRAHRIELPGGDMAIHAPGLTLLPLAGAALASAFEPGWVAPAYGERHAAPRLVCQQRAADGWFASLLVPGDDIPALHFAADSDSVTVDGQRFALDQGAVPC
jgi:hypothetical protein